MHHSRNISAKWWTRGGMHLESIWSCIAQGHYIGYYHTGHPHAKGSKANPFLHMYREIPQMHASLTLCYNVMNKKHHKQTAKPRLNHTSEKAVKKQLYGPDIWSDEWHHQKTKPNGAGQVKWLGWRARSGGMMSTYSQHLRTGDWSRRKPATEGLSLTDNHTTITLNLSAQITHSSINTRFPIGSTFLKRGHLTNYLHSGCKRILVMWRFMYIVEQKNSLLWNSWREFNLLYIVYFYCTLTPWSHHRNRRPFFNLSHPAG